jgi:hypothetical protein
MHLYELSERYKNILTTIENDDQFDEEILRQNLMEITLLFEEKVESMAKIIKGLEASQTAYKAESERLAQKAKATQSKMDWLKNYLIVEMQNAKQEKVQGIVLSVSVKSNPPSCKVIDEKLIPNEFFRIIPETKEVDKIKLIANLKSTGESVPGVEFITDKKSLQIK